MVKLFYTTYISVDLAHHEIFRAKFGKGGISRTRRPRLFQRYSIGSEWPVSSVDMVGLQSVPCHIAAMGSGIVLMEERSVGHASEGLHPASFGL